jgi:allantoin racemase
MKIGVVHVTTEASSGPYTELITGTLARAKRPETELVHRYVGHMRRATDAAVAYPTLLNKVDVIAQMVQLEQEGVDAVMVACSGDPGVQEARSLLKIPVVGPMEAAMALACSYGWRFGILTVADRSWASCMDQLVHTYGFGARYVGLRQLHTPTHVLFTKGFDDPSIVKVDLEARARELVRDGADAILIGTAGIGTFATSFGFSKVDDPEVPVFDVCSVGIKFAELRAELQQQLGVPPVSRAGWHEEFPVADRERVDRLFGWVDVPEPVTS